MGYTHYWTVKQPFTLTRDEVNVLKSYFAEHSEIPVRLEYNSKSPPSISAQEIRFNGVGKMGHEGFLLNPTAEGWDFCKTARKPYDFLVCLTLLFVRAAYPDSFTFSSDGGLRENEWVPAVTYLVDNGYDRELLESFFER